MWRNLAKVQSTIATIGNVVAPAMESDDDDDDYEEYEDEYLDHEEGEETQNHLDGNSTGNQMENENHRHHGHYTRQAAPAEADDIHSQPKFPEYNQQQRLTEENSQNMQRQNRSGAGFGGFVGLLAKALDAEQEDYDESPYQDEGEDEEVNFDSWDETEKTEQEGGFVGSRFIQSSPPATETDHPFNLSLIAEEGALMDSTAEIVVEDDLLDDPPEKGEVGEDDRLHDVLVVDSEDGEGNTTLPPVVGDDHTTISTTSELGKLQERVSNFRELPRQELPEPMRTGLVRESGSVTPSPHTVRSVKSLSGRLSPKGELVQIEHQATDVESSPAKHNESLPTQDQKFLDGDTLTASEISSIPWTPTESIPSEIPEAPEPEAPEPVAIGSASVEEQEPFSQPVEEVVQPSSDQASSGNHQSAVSASTVVPGDAEAVDSSRPSRGPPTSAFSNSSLTPASPTPQGTANSFPPKDSNYETTSMPQEMLPENKDVTRQSPLPATVKEPEPLPTLQNEYTLPVASAVSLPAPDDSEVAAANNVQSTLDDEERKRLESRIQQLEQELLQAHSRILNLEKQGATAQQNELQLLERFQEKEARLLAAAAEDHEQEMRFLRSEMDVKLNSMQQELQQEREASEREREFFEQLIAEANGRAERAERQLQTERRKQETAVSQYQKHQERELQMTNDKLVQSMALLDEREEQVTKLKAMVQTLQSRLSEHAEGAQVAEEEVEELHHENEELRQHVQSLESKCADLRGRVAELQSESDMRGELRMEVRLLKEALDRERLKSQSETAAAHGNRAQVEEERDRALAQVLDLQQQLRAALADLEMARTDTERVVMARNNLQVALESFQSEREAELALLEEQRRESERGIAAAHAASLDAMREASNAHIREIQMAAEAAVRHNMDEIHNLESKLESFRTENVQMRRSLDEAISRLQATQEDVIDRTLMKNILIDWLTKTGAKERRDVLELMASVLHFTEDEKERVHIGDHSGTLERVVHTVVVPLPPPKADVEHLAGDNVREKWVNFLLAETDD